MEPNGERLLSERSDATDALRFVRAEMATAVGLMKVAEAAATALMQLTAADEASISLLDGDHYWDIVDVSRDPLRGTLYPDDRYLLSDYPVGSERLLAGRGYIGGDENDEVMIEYARQVPHAPVGSIMSSPIIALGGVHGEVFLIRKVGAPSFTRDELDLLSECAPLLGARLPALIAAYKKTESDPVHSEAMAGLTEELDALLESESTD